MSIKRTAAVAKHLSAIEDAKLFFEEMKGRREDYAGNRADRWHESEKGEAFVEDTESLDDIISSLEESYNGIEDLFEEI